MPFADSLWHHTAGDSFAPRAPLPGDLEADVAIVGGGYTGLWTAYYLHECAECSSRRRRRASHAGTDRTPPWRCGGQCTSRSSRWGWRTLRGSTPTTPAAARSRSRATRRSWFASASWSRTSGGSPARSSSSTSSRRRRPSAWPAARASSGPYTPHCAALHPLRLVRGLATCVEGRGVSIFERTPASALRQGEVITTRGTVRAEVVVRATEGYTASLRGERRRLVPLYSLMIATEPLPGEAWAQIGLRRRETFADLRHMRIYGQRTADDRLAFGGRGAPYHFASRTRPGFDRDGRVHAALCEVLVDLFPPVREFSVTHQWGGALGVPRDWHASVGFERERGLAWAGGYVGDGVATANLAGRTLAQLITGQESELTRLPWVAHRSRSWEPEPLRWLGVNGGRLLLTGADRAEARSGKPARSARAFARFIGY